MTIDVIKVGAHIARPFVLKKHYAHRMPICWECFGLVVNELIDGVVIYGQPSPPIQRHAFRKRNFRLYELSRLVIQTALPNAASLLIGRSLQMLASQPCAVVSYADTEWGHSGIVYQATNWIYTGAVKSHDHTYLVNGVRTHPITLRDRGISDPKRWARENNITTLPPCIKHRYFYLIGTRKQRRDMLANLNYPVITSYPKSPKQLYHAGPLIDVRADLVY
jgi:hypothetical protein